VASQKEIQVEPEENEEFPLKKTNYGYISSGTYHVVPEKDRKVDVYEWTRFEEPQPTR
jgi:hypothetical protein